MCDNQKGWLAKKNNDKVAKEGNEKEMFLCSTFIDTYKQNKSIEAFLLQQQIDISHLAKNEDSSYFLR